MVTRDHRRIRRRVDAYVDGALEPPAQREVREHLRECAGCRRTVILMDAVKRSLRRLSADAPFPLATERLRRIVARLAGGETHGRPAS